MKTKFFLSSILFVFFSFVNVLAQFKEHITWVASVENVTELEATLVLKATIDKSWHLYGQYFDDGGPNKLEIKYMPSAEYTVVGKTIETPKPKVERDDIFGVNVALFEHAATFSQKIKLNTTKPFNIKSSVNGQICQTDGSCILTQKEFNFSITPLVKNNTVTTVPVMADSAAKLKTDTANAKACCEKTEIIKAEIETTAAKDNSLLLFFWISFLAGLLAILTPCVFPMIPMTVSFFMHGTNKAKARFQAVFYGASIILIYTIIGTLVAFTLGPSFANFLSTHWLPNILFFLIFVVFAASFFGVFEIVLPSWLITKADKQVDKGGFLGPFFMAFTLVLVSFSCTGPIVGAVLVQSAGGAFLRPVIGMLGFSLAFALPFTLFALFPAWLNNLPKSGGWLNSVKVVLGFIELALGLKFLSMADLTYHWHLLDREVYLAIWIVITVLLGFYLLGKLKFPHDSDVKNITFTRLILAIATFSFAVYMVPGLWGAPLKALSGYIPPLTTQDFNLYNVDNQNNTSKFGIQIPLEKPKYSDFLKLPHGLQGYFEWNQALAESKRLGKPVFVDFTGHGCANCRKMEENVWADPKVLSRLRNEFVILSLYVDDKTELPENEWIKTSNGAVKKTIGAINSYIQETQFQSNAQPHYIILNSEGKTLGKPRYFDQDVDGFVNFLDTGKRLFDEIKR